MKYKQSGHNDAYPNTINTWRYGEPVPEWLSDRVKIVAIDSETGNPLIDMTETTSGGFEVKDSTGEKVLFRTSDRHDYICFGDSKIFVLTTIQLGLLYEEDI